MKFNLSLKRPNDDNTTVVLIAFINQRRFKTGLGVNVPTKAWDKSSQRLKTGTSKDLIALQSEIDNAVQAIVHLHNQLVVNDGVELSVESMRDGVKRMRDGKAGVAEKVLTFNLWVDEYIKEMERGERLNSKGQQITETTIKKHRTVQKQLLAFTKKVWGRPIRFDEIDQRFVEKYQTFRGKQGVGVNTIAKDTAVLKSWVKESYQREVHENRKWEARFFTPKEVKTTKAHLTVEELKMLEKVKFPARGKFGGAITAKPAVRDMFLLSCWTAARISDAVRFPEIVAAAWKANGDKCPDSIEFVQSKTNSLVTMPLLPPAKRIIKKHKGQLPKMPNQQKVNSIIKEIVKEAGIKRELQMADTTVNRSGLKSVPLYEKISFHSARRSFATNVYQMGIMSLGELMSLTGHETEASLMVYLEVTREDVSKRAAEKLLAAFKDA